MNDINLSSFLFEPGQPTILFNPFYIAARNRQSTYRDAVNYLRDMYNPDNWRVAYQVGPGLVLFSSIKKLKPKHD